MNELIETDWIVAEPRTRYDSPDLLLKDETYELIGICMDVHRTLGCGFLEVVYKDALEKEFGWKNIPFEREKKITIDYKGIILPHTYFADFVIRGNIILELKAQQSLPDSFYAQVINYLAVSKCPVGLLVNFGDTSLKYKRFALTKNKSAQSAQSAANEYKDKN